MGNDQEGTLRRALRIDAIGDGFQCVDIEARIGLIEDGKLGLQQRHLENFIALFFTARKSFVDGAMQ